MKVLLIVLIILLIIVIIPIKIKIEFVLNEQDYYLKIFNFKVFSKNKKKKGTQKKEKSKKKKKPSKPNKLKEKFLSLNFFKNFLLNMNCAKYKPSLKIEGDINYSLNDSYNTAISYGAISTALPFLYRVIYIFFNYKEGSLKISPLFKDKFLYDIQLKSIITISLGQIINTGLIILKSIR